MRVRNRDRLITAAFLAVCVFLCANVAMACPNCKDGLAETPGAANLIRGYFWSIVFMMSMPFVILGSLIGYFYYEVRKARQKMKQVLSA